MKFFILTQLVIHLFINSVAFAQQNTLSFSLQTPNPSDPPEWTKDLIIYELNPRGFTSPEGVGDGHGSGTWKSLTDKLTYIADLGVTGIWITGHNLANDHFNCWCSYATITPEELDPVLGTEQDFKKMVDKAHYLGLKIILESVSHGLVNESPLVKEHPDWFKGSSWGMADFDYSNEEFRKWWIDVHVKYVLEYGVDGFRVDGPNGAQGWGYAGFQVMEVWDEITKVCEEQGHPILVFPENGRYHFSQIDHWTEEDWNPLFNEIRDVAAFSNRTILSGTEKMQFDPRGLQYICHEISCHDNGANNVHGATLNNGSRCRFGYYAIFGPNVPLFYGGEEFMFYSISEGQAPVPMKMLPCLENKNWDNLDNWWYGAQLQWDLLKKEPHKSMYEDCKKILKIRKENNDILHYNRFETYLIGLQSTPAKPVPYARYIPGEKAIVIIGNDYEHKKLNFTIDIPLEKMELNGHEKYKITDLWNDEVSVMSEKELEYLHVNVPADYTPGGGVRIIKIEPIK